MEAMSPQRGIGVYQPRSRRAQMAELLGELRQRFHEVMRIALWRLLGCALLVMGTAMLVSIAGYDATDRSFDVATGKHVANWLGQIGADTADLLLRVWGLSALALAAAIAGWGWQILAKGAWLGNSAWRSTA